MFKEELESQRGCRRIHMGTKSTEVKRQAGAMPRRALQAVGDSVVLSQLDEKWLVPLQESTPCIP